MRCRCGNEINHVPEHLRDLANWVCQQCTNTAPRTNTVSVMTSEEPIYKQVPQRQKKDAA